ncbi:MAG: hypothetical protein R3F11_24690, partial [Verrucomicrobiales bacterium]
DESAAAVHRLNEKDTEGEWSRSFGIELFGDELEDPRGLSSPRNCDRYLPRITRRNGGLPAKSCPAERANLNPLAIGWLFEAALLYMSKRTMTFEEALPVLLDEVSKVGALPDVPVEAEDYFTNLVSNFTDLQLFRHYLQSHVPEIYKSLVSYPEWIQDPDWPWENGVPMIFVGSIDPPPGTFHDEARFFLFWSPTVGTTKCIIQVA